MLDARACALAPAAMMSRPPIATTGGFRDTVAGYNHQIPYEGRIYHVQTEDSGRNKRHIHTHVFHAGTIVASARVDYEDGALDGDVCDLLRKSHKSMLRKLVRGLLDEAIARRLGPRPKPRALPAADAEPSKRPAPTPAPPDHAEIITRTDPEAGEAQSAAPAPNRRQEPPLDMDNINQVLESLKSNVGGTLGVALVDFESGMCLGSVGNGIDVDVAAAGNTEVMKAKMRVMRDLGIKGGIDDILITLEPQYHIIRPVGTSMFLYLAIDRERGNLALARHKLKSAADTIQL